MFNRNVYEVDVELRIKAKIKTQAHDAEEARDNVLADYDDSTTEEFLENYDWDVNGSIDIGEALVVDKPY